MVKESLFKMTYGLYVVSSKNGNKLNGYISNTVFQVTSEPVQMAVVCSKDNFTADMIVQSKVFSISALRKDTKTQLIGTFGYKSGRTLDKFPGFNYKNGRTGVPILLEDTIAWFECELIQTIDAGSHLIFIGTVIDGDLTDASGEPLTYSYYRDVKKGKAPKNAPTYIDIAKIEANLVATGDKYVCPACGYIYDPQVGDPVAGIPAGARFEDLPDSWGCPVCGTEKADFIKKEND
jgi:flavin reductase (DIM6/NTAB) family NADH-FMN oxidoreductase RutF/rubredoxin